VDHKRLKKKQRLFIIFVLIGLICFILVEWLIVELRQEDGDWIPVNKELEQWFNWGQDFAPAEPRVININEGSEADLTTLTGIGPAKAKEIIAYRTKQGPFVSIEEIMEVTGIGPATYENIKDWITVGEERDELKEKQEGKTETRPEESDEESN